MPKMRHVFNYSLRALLVGILIITLHDLPLPRKTPLSSTPSRRPTAVLVPLGLPPSTQQQARVMWVLAHQGWRRWRWMPTQPLPTWTYSAKFRRHRAERVIRFLVRRYKQKGHWILGVTSADISTDLQGFVDHAVLGLAEPHDHTMLLSSARLPKYAPDAAWRSLVLHEWGHLLKLKHCPHSLCVMFDRMGQPADQPWSERFCQDCARLLHQMQPRPSLPSPERQSP